MVLALIASKEGGGTVSSLLVATKFVDIYIRTHTGSKCM